MILLVNLYPRKETNPSEHYIILEKWNYYLLIQGKHIWLVIISLIVKILLDLPLIHIYGLLK